jgi:hypothetical protein
VWSAVSALLLMVQVPNSEPVDRFLPRTGVGDLFKRITDGVFTEVPERMEKFMRFDR